MKSLMLAIALLGAQEKTAVPSYTAPVKIDDV